ncbi:unnamed protein product, partial [Nesidiocoris tenuis]
MTKKTNGDPGWGRQYNLMMTRPAWTIQPNAMIGKRPTYFINVPKTREQMALTTPKQIMT